MRLFIGISLSNEVKTALKLMQDYIKPSIYRANFIPYNNFHITSVYLGEFPSHTVDDYLIAMLDSIATKTEPFFLSIGDIGSFNRRGKHTLWANILKGKSNLIKLYQQILSVLEIEEIYLEQRKYFPHVTLAKDVFFSQLLEDSVDIEVLPMSMKVEKITLFESKITHIGLEYIVLHEALFK